jgi:hypothetical protein
MPRLPARIHDAAAKLLRSADVSLRPLSTGALRELATSTNPVHRELVRRQGTPGLTPGSVLAAIDTEEIIGPATLLFDRVPAEPGARSEALHQAIVLDSATYPLRRHAALLCVRRHADEILSGHARTILHTCLNLASQPVDPYAPVALAMAAKTAAAALIARNPSFDKALHARLRAGNGVRELTLVQAAALQRRRIEYGSGIASTLEALQTDERRAHGFARDCDRQYSALDSAGPAAGRLDRLRSWLRSPRVRFAVAAQRVVSLVAVVALPAAGLAGSLTTDAWLHDLPGDIRVGTGEALTALGLLVAVHVISAELVADRLAGPIARTSSFPLPLQAGYFAGLMLLAVSVLAGESNTASMTPTTSNGGLAAESGETYSAATLGIVVALLLLVLWALITLLRRTDPVRAVNAFARRQRAAVLAAGRELGRVHRATLHQRELLAGYPWVLNALTVPRSERRVPIIASRSGYLLLHRRRLRGLAERSIWKEERARLATVASIGLRTSHGDEVMSVIPAVDQILDRRELRRVRRLPHIRRRPRIDRVEEHLSILLGVASAQSAGGNLSGAEQVRERALELIDLHLRAVRARRGSNEEESIGMVPALRTAAVQGLGLLNAAGDPNSREVMLGFLHRLLALTDAADGFGTLLASQLAFTGERPSVDIVRQLLWDCGSRAIEVNDELALREVQQQVDRLLSREEGDISLGGRLAQFAAVTRPRRADELWRWHAGRTSTESTFPLTAIRVGASALLVGNASLALTAALALRTSNAKAWEDWFEQRDVADRETVNDQLYGRLLGADPQYALQEFVRFMARAVAAVKPGPEEAPWPYRPGNVV